MKQLFPVRLSPDVLQRAKKIAAKEDRSVASVIDRTLREAFSVTTVDIRKAENILRSSHGVTELTLASEPVIEMPMSPEVSAILGPGAITKAINDGVAKAMSKPDPASVLGLEADSEGRYRRCKHGNNEWTCSATACKINTNR